MRLLVLVVALGAAAVDATPGLAVPGPPREEYTAADQALARHTLLRLADLPAGWKSGAAPTAERGDLTCPGFRPSLGDVVVTGRASSRDYTRGEGEHVASFALVFRRAADALAAFDRIFRPGFLRCQGGTLGAQPGSPLRMRVLSLQGGRLPGHPGPAWSERIRMRFTGAGLNFVAEAEYVFVERDRAIAGLFLFRFPPPIDRTLEARLLRVLERRLAG